MKSNIIQTGIFSSKKHFYIKNMIGFHKRIWSFIMEAEEIESAIREIIDVHGSTDFSDVSPMEESLVALLRKINWYALEGEWCWFNNSGRSATVAQFQEKKDGLFIDTEGNEWEECMKFEGELPPHLKIGLSNAR